MRNLTVVGETAMKNRTGRRKVVQVLALSLAGAAWLLALRMSVAGPTSTPGDATVTSLLSRDLSHVVGKELSMITVEYAPGESDPVHTHHAQALIYVLDGSVVMQVRGGESVTLSPGETFYEGPDDVHVVGRNASQTAPAKFLVFLVKEKGAPILTPVK
jgi:quercetin dioxygenase-like cupin family protein